ncbi:MAG TPA: YdeI/OmpD-associated family protein [Chitinophagaceae bacterium]|nr:YdeI/OmpD-associated family protein [Chitinophagaceae bacterium]
MYTFSAKIYKIGVNPYVLLPSAVLKQLFKQAGRDKGPIPVCVKINGHKFIQTLVKYSGKWRLYLNTPMRKAANLDVGDTAKIEIQYDAMIRSYPMNPKLSLALKQNKNAKATFDKLSPSRQKEIIRYINFLKNEESVERNISRAIKFLTGKDRFAGRDKP